MRRPSKAVASPKHLLWLGLMMTLFVPAVGASGEAQVRQGESVWVQERDRMPLEITFTPKGDGVWTASFDFTFSSNRHTYTGTVHGSLEDGLLEGTVRNETRRRTFVLKGTVENGVFEGTHAEIRRGSERHTGTLTFGPEPAD